MTSDLVTEIWDPITYEQTRNLHSFTHTFSITKTNLILSNQTPTSDLVDDLVHIEIISR